MGSARLCLGTAQMEIDSSNRQEAPEGVRWNIRGVSRSVAG